MTASQSPPSPLCGTKTVPGRLEDSMRHNVTVLPPRAWPISDTSRLRSSLSGGLHDPRVCRSQLNWIAVRPAETVTGGVGRHNPGPTRDPSSIIWPHTKRAATSPRGSLWPAFCPVGAAPNVQEGSSLPKQVLGWAGRCGCKGGRPAGCERRLRPGSVLEPGPHTQCPELVVASG